MKRDKDRREVGPYLGLETLKSQESLCKGRVLPDSFPHGASPKPFSFGFPEYLLRLQSRGLWYLVWVAFDRTTPRSFHLATTFT